MMQYDLVYTLSGPKYLSITMGWWMHSLMLSLGFVCNHILQHPRDFWRCDRFLLFFNVALKIYTSSVYSLVHHLHLNRGDMTCYHRSMEKVILGLYHCVQAVSPLQAMLLCYVKS